MLTTLNLWLASQNKLRHGRISNRPECKLFEGDGSWLKSSSHISVTISQPSSMHRLCTNALYRGIDARDRQLSALYKLKLIILAALSLPLG